MPPGVKADSAKSTETPKPSSSSTSSTSTQQSKPKVPEPQEDVVMEDDEDAKAKKEADEYKAKGTTAYKARKFDEAEEMYQKAWDTCPKDITYLTNLSGRSRYPNILDVS